MSQGYLKYLDDGPPIAIRGVAGGTIVPGDPVVRDAGGTVSVAALDAVVVLGWTMADGTAAAATKVPVIPASDRTHWVIPLSGTVGGGILTTAAGQTTAGATLGHPGVRTPGATLLALIGGFYSLQGASTAWTGDVADTSNTLLQLVDYVYNEGTGLYEGEFVVESAKRQHGVIVV